MKKLFLILLAIAPFYINGQNIIDIYNISAVNYQGTAKSAAMGNAMGAVGEDFSAISINPAGLGLYRKSTFSFTPSLSTSYTMSEYYGNIEHDDKTNFTINNVGYVSTNSYNNIKINWAFGMNKTNNFNSSSFVSGFNPNNSLIDAYFAEIIANDIYDENQLYEYSPSYIYPIWDVWLFDFNSDGSLTAYVPEGNIQQLKGVTSWGGTNEWTLSTSFNFNDKLFLGMSVNVSNVNYRKISDYKEVFELDGDSYSWLQQENLSTTGSGINYKVGLIAYPASWLRIGAAIHSSTIYNLTDTWRTETMSWDRILNVPTSYFDYYLQTPWIFNGSVAFILGNFAMITADCEYIDYSSIALSAYDYDYSNYNDMLSYTFKPSMNIRLGAEWRYQNMCFRGGYALYGSPYGIKAYDGYYNFHNRNAFSCGFGYTQHGFTIDVAYVYSYRHNNYDLYSQYTNYYTELSNNNVVHEKTNLHNLIVSFKFRLY